MRALVIASAMCLSILGIALATDAQATMRMPTNIQPQGLGAALQALAKAREFQIVYRPEYVRDRTTSGAAGELTRDEALARVLADTGLTFRYLNENTVTIEPLGVNRNSGSAPTQSSERRGALERSTSFWSRFHLAQTDAPSPSQGAGRGEDREPATADQKSADTAQSQKRVELEEIIVTSQKREERLQDIPMSVSVLSGQDLDRSSAQNVNDVLSLVPGVVASARAGAAAQGSTLLAIRGVSAPNSFNSGSSPIGYYLDAMPVGFVRMAVVPDPNVYDLDRVEVLRGPQGTLYGAGSQNGVVRVLTHDADMDRFELKARVLYSTTEEGDDSSRADMAINVPVIEGKVAARAVVGYQKAGGWIDKPDRADANDARLRNGRIKIDAQPTDLLSIAFSGWMLRSDYGAPSVSDGNGHSPFLNIESGAQDFDAYALKVGYEFPLLSVTSTTSYLDFVYSDASATLLGNSPVLLTTRLPAKTFSQEINLSSGLKGPWRWTAGGIYRDGQDRLFQQLSVVPLPQSVRFDSKSWAVFGELTRSFLDGKWELTGGLRHFEDDVPMQEESRLGAAPPASFISTDRKFHATTPRVALVWHPRSDVSAYGSYSEGFRSGFDQLPSVLAGAAIPDVKPDRLRNYEIGAKGTLWDRVSFDMAVYYIDWRDVQLPLGVSVNGVLRSAAVNGPSASGLGADMAFTIRPGRGLTLGINAGWNDLSVDSDVTAGSVIVIRKGERLSVSPEFTIAGLIDYTFAFGDSGYRGTLSGSLASRSRLTTVTLVGTNRLSGTGDTISTDRVSFAVDSPVKWTASLFVDNLNNEHGIAGPALAPNLPARPRPRTYGLQLDYRF